jgi:predicted RNase H-like nuclease (RuvC/YqgF family)
MDLEELQQNIETLKAENEQLKETILKVENSQKEFKNEYNQFKTNTVQVINGGIVGTQSHEYDVNKEVKEILKLK